MDKVRAMSVFNLQSELIHHTGVFNWKVNTALTGAGIGVCVAAAIVILGSLHHSIAPFNTLSSTSLCGIAGAGGVLLLANSIALFILSKKHSRINAQIKDSLKMHDTSDWQKKLSDFTKGSTDLEYADLELPSLFTVMQNHAGKGSIHLFADKGVYTAFVDRLKNKGYCDVKLYYIPVSSAPLK